MVGHTRRKWKTRAVAGCAALGMAAGAIGTPAGAQDRPGSILERMQDEVANVARQSRAAIVTIEDSRAVAADYANSALRKTDLEDQIARLLNDKKAVDAEVTQRQTQFNAGAATLQDLAKPRADQARLEARLAFLRQRLANVGKENPQTEQIAELQMESSILQSELNNAKETLQVEQGRYAAGLSSRDKIIELQRQVADAQMRLIEANAKLRQASAQAALRQNSDLVNAVVLQPTPPRSGSGFSIGDGLIVTTADVAQGMNNPVVTTDDGRQARATLVAIDTRLNIALLRLSANLNLPALKLGDSASVMPGHFAITMGNQVGQTNSVALSTISALRTQGLTSASHYYPELLQIDGTVSAGTSGAPVLNARGEVIGMLAATPTADTRTVTQNPLGFTYSGATLYSLPSAQSLSIPHVSLPMKLKWMQSPTYKSMSPAITLPAPSIQSLPGTRKIQPPTPSPSGTAPAAPANRSGNPPVIRFTDTASGQPDPMNSKGVFSYKIVRDAKTGGYKVFRMPDGASTNAPKSADLTASNQVTQALANASQPPPLIYYFYDPTTKAIRTMTEAEAAQIKAQPSMFYDRQTGVWIDKEGRTLSILQPITDPTFVQSLTDALTPATAPASTSSGFAIPVNAMKSVLDTLKSGKNVVHAWLGMNLEDVDNARADNGIVRLDKQVKISGIYDRSPASKAGLKLAGDILVGLDETPVHTSNDVRSAILLRFKPGQNITAHLLRAGKPLDISLTLESLPAPVPPLLTAPGNMPPAK